MPNRIDHQPWNRFSRPSLLWTNIQISISAPLPPPAHAKIIQILLIPPLISLDSSLKYLQVQWDWHANSHQWKWASQHTHSWWQTYIKTFNWRCVYFDQRSTIKCLGRSRRLGLDLWSMGGPWRENNHDMIIIKHLSILFLNYSCKCIDWWEKGCFKACPTCPL